MRELAGPQVSPATSVQSVSTRHRVWEIRHILIFPAELVLVTQKSLANRRQYPLAQSELLVQVV